MRVDAEGKPSHTRFRINQRYQQATLIEASPLTGRTHQIRVHCQHVGHPIAGDPKYGDTDFDELMRVRAEAFVPARLETCVYTPENRAKHPV